MRRRSGLIEGGLFAFDGRSRTQARLLGEHVAVDRGLAGRPYAIDDHRLYFSVAFRRVLPLSQGHLGIVDAVPDCKRL